MPKNNETPSESFTAEVLIDSYREAHEGKVYWHHSSVAKQRHPGDVYGYIQVTLTRGVSAKGLPPHFNNVEVRYAA